MAEVALDHRQEIVEEQGEAAPLARITFPVHAPPPLAAFDDEIVQDNWMTYTWLYSIPNMWTWKDYLDVSEKLRAVVGFGIWPNHTSQLNNNPWAWPTSTLPGYATYSPQLVQYHEQSIADSAAWWSMIAALEQQVAPTLPPGWLQPWVPPPANPMQQHHVDLLVHGFLRLFAAESGQFLVSR